MCIHKDFTVFYIRHGESRGNADLPYMDEFHHDDPPLSLLGLQQAENLTKFPYVKQIDTIYSSTLVRTVQTAYPVAKMLNKKITMLPELMEYSTAIYTTPTEYIGKNYPLAIPCVEGTSPVGAKLAFSDETPQTADERARKCLEYFADKTQDGETVAVFAHGMFFGYFVRAALGLSLPEAFCWQVDNCGVTGIRFYKDRIPKLLFANYTVPIESE